MPAERSFNSVSILIPVFNEEQYIETCLDSLLGGHFPADQLEILVIDGGSNDDTRSIVERYGQTHPQVKLLSNPGKIVSLGLNIGANAASGEILIWVGAHAEYDQHYISKSVSLLMETGAASVGGRLTARGEGKIGRGIAMAFSLPTGTGNARYRSGNEAGWVDTVFGGCWWKKDFLQIGGFDGGWVVNQDTEFNYRLRQEIGGIYFSPEIRCTYFVRSSIQRVAKQYFRYGMWRARTFLRHPGSLRPRQAVPTVFVITLLLFIAAIPWSGWPLIGLVMVYSGLLSLVLSKVENTDFATRFIALICTIVLHCSWGFGFLVGLATGSPKSSKLLR